MLRNWELLEEEKHNQTILYEKIYFDKKNTKKIKGQQAGFHQNQYFGFYFSEITYTRHKLGGNNYKSYNIMKDLYQEKINFETN